MRTEVKEPYCPFGNQVRQIRAPGDVFKTGHHAGLDVDLADELTVSLWLAVDEPPTGTSDPHGTVLEKWSGKGGYPYALHHLGQAAGDDRGRLRALRSDG